MQLLIIPITVAGTLLTYAASYDVLETLTTLEPPRLLAAVVALLSSLSLLSLGDGAVTLILVPYATLGLSLLMLLLFKWLGGLRVGRTFGHWLGKPPHSKPRRPRGALGRPWRSADPSPARRRETLTIKE